MNESEFDERLVNLNDALLSLKMVMAAKKSSESKMFINLKSFNPNI
jgi:hypothetical protein